MSWSSLAWLALVVACGAEAHTTPRADSARQLGRLEGYVLDSETNAPLAGATIDTTYRHQDGKSALTDEHGYYGLEWPVGVVEILAGVGTATSSISSLEVVDGRATAFDIRIGHAALVASLRADPPLNCPGSSASAVIEGHTTSRATISTRSRARCCSVSPQTGRRCRGMGCDSVTQFVFSSSSRGIAG